MSHIRLRGSVYQYERRVPKDLVDNPAAFRTLFGSQKLFRKSLRTSDHTEALLRAYAVEKEFEDLVRQAQGHVVRLAQSQLPRRQVTKETLGEIAHYIAHSFIERWRSIKRDASLSADGADNYVRALTRFTENELPLIRQAIDDPSYRRRNFDEPAGPYDRAREINHNWDFDVPENSTAFGEMVLAAADGMRQGLEGAEKIYEGHSLPPGVTSTLIQDYAPKAVSSSSRTISEVIEVYCQAGNFPPKTMEKIERSRNAFIEVIGNKPIDQITAADIRVFVEWAANRKAAGKPVARDTVQDYLGFIRAPLNFAIDRGWLVSANPAAGIKVDRFVIKADPRTMPRKRPFEVGELNQLFQHPWFAGCLSARQPYQKGEHLIDDSRYWLPIVALYTGCRASELGGLKLSEVVTTAFEPYFNIAPNEYRRIKNGEARKVPLLDALRKVGFDGYLERICASGADRLFPDWQRPKSNGKISEDETLWSNAKWIRAFNRTVLPSALKGTFREGIRHEVTFHSFRGAFKTMLRSAGVSREHRDAIVGHAQPDLDERYMGSIPLEELYAAVHQCDYRGLILPDRCVEVQQAA